MQGKIEHIYFSLFILYIIYFNILLFAPFYIETSTFVSAFSRLWFSSRIDSDALYTVIAVYATASASRLYSDGFRSVHKSVHFPFMIFF